MQLQGQESNFGAFLADSAVPVGKAIATQKKKKQKDTVPDWLGEMFLQGGRCSRIRGEERSFLPMEEPQATAEDMGAATKAFLEN